VLSGRGLCDELITRPEESYRLLRRRVWSRNSKNGCSIYIYIYIYDISCLRVKNEQRAGGRAVAGHKRNTPRFCLLVSSYSAGNGEARQYVQHRWARETSHTQNACRIRIICGPGRNFRNALILCSYGNPKYYHCCNRTPWLYSWYIVYSPNVRPSILCSKHVWLISSV